jgi:hypothetical protein
LVGNAQTIPFCFEHWGRGEKEKGHLVGKWDGQAHLSPHACLPLTSGHVTFGCEHGCFCSGMRMSLAELVSSRDATVTGKLKQRQRSEVPDIESGNAWIPEQVKLLV